MIRPGKLPGLLPPALLFFFILSGPPAARAQKVEIERRIAPQALPDTIHAFLEAGYPGRRRIRYYYERNETGDFYEAKFRAPTGRYSVKFYPDGRLYNTERYLPPKELTEALAGRMCGALAERLRRFRIVRIQEQLADGQVTGYEVEIRGRSDTHLGYFEAHFDPNGEWRDLRTVEEPPNDFLFF